jgi:hypothetical protein
VRFKGEALRGVEAALYFLEHSLIDQLPELDSGQAVGFQFFWPDYSCSGES